MRWTVIDTPIGELSLTADDIGVCGVHFGRVDPAVGTEAVEIEPAQIQPDEIEPAVEGVSAEGGALELAVAELRAYFAGELTDFTAPLSVRRGTDFERAVWRQMSLIPYGETRTYGEVAAAVGDPGGARAVGVACNRNPIPVIVPCHRIVGAGNKLVGFGGGLPRKRQLLELEARVALQRAWAG